MAKNFSPNSGAPRECVSHLNKPAELPDFTSDIPADDDVEHWMLSTLRFVQAQDVAEKANYDPESIPAYTRDGFERIQKLRLTVAEAQFASQFNGVPFYCPDRAESAAGFKIRSLDALPFRRTRHR